MTTEHLTAVLAEKVKGWSIGPDRFMMGGRRWLPRWRFQPATRLEDAFRLLKRAAPQDYRMGAAKNGGFWARVRVAGATGEAHDSSQARALTLAVARALRLELPEEFEPSGRTSDGRDKPSARSNSDVT